MEAFKARLFRERLFPMGEIIKLPKFWFHAYPLSCKDIYFFAVDKTIAAFAVSQGRLYI